MKIMIVDDEELIRNHLAHLTEWSDLGCQITGVAANGVEALERIPADKPDLVITDIRMPLMNGIQLAEQIKARFPHIRFLFLTAFNDFQYAQHAVKLGAADFILKPIQNAELLRSVELIMQGEERTSREDRLKQEQVIQSMLSPVVNERDKYAVASEKGLENREIIVVCVVIDNADVLIETGEVYSFVALREAMTQILDYNPYSYWDYSDSKGLYLILFKPHGDLWEMRGDSMKMAGDMLDRCKESFPFAVSICISKVKPSILYLHQAWKEIKDCLDYRMLLGKGSIISNDALPNRVQGNINGADQLNELIVMLRKGEKEKVPSYLLSISREMMGKGLTKTNIHTFALQVIQRVEVLLLEYNLRIPEEIQLQTRKTILSFDILFDLMLFLEQWLEESADRILATNRNQSMNGLVKEICTYLRSKSAEDMSLERLADYFHMNHSYLSRLIKKETGQNFRDLLWSYRIEAAKRMLIETRMKANEIAYEVGFKDPAHFSILFKKHVGLSPMNYREQIK